VTNYTLFSGSLGEYELLPLNLGKTSYWFFPNDGTRFYYVSNQDAGEVSFDGKVLSWGRMDFKFYYVSQVEPGKVLLSTPEGEMRLLRFDKKEKKVTFSRIKIDLGPTSNPWIFGNQIGMLRGNVFQLYRRVGSKYKLVFTSNSEEVLDHILLKELRLLILLTTTSDLLVYSLSSNKDPVLAGRLGTGKGGIWSYKVHHSGSGVWSLINYQNGERYHTNYNLVENVSCTRKLPEGEALFPLGTYLVRSRGKKLSFERSKEVQVELEVDCKGITHLDEVGLSEKGTKASLGKLIILIKIPKVLLSMIVDFLF